MNGADILSVGMMLRTAMYMVVVSGQKRVGRLACLRMHLLCAVRFHLLDEVLNVPLHCMPVEFDRFKHDLVLAAPRFEAVSVHKFSCAIAAYGLGSPQSAANSSRCCQGSSRVRVLITAPRLDPTSSTTSA